MSPLCWYSSLYLTGKNGYYGVKTTWIKESVNIVDNEASSHLYLFSQVPKHLLHLKGYYQSKEILQILSEIQILFAASRDDALFFFLHL